ncbi:MAG: pyridoxamine 5'-phosphate oxidase family protein [Christensenellaceae bacterium]|jgi:general stress protein 26|nr:pyridoxamine 5'-phosphate oxidase family protein [Christensenellaceae bacterium]
MHENILVRAGEIVSHSLRQSGYCALALLDEDGFPHASTITPSAADGVRSIYLCTGFGSRTASILACNKASLCFNSMEYNITLLGTIEILTDPALKLAMWYGGLKNHFSGPEDEKDCVLHFKTERYSLLVDWNQVRGSL